MEELPGSLEHGFELILGKLDEMMAKLLPSDWSPRLMFHNLQWETLLCPPVIGFLMGLLFLFRLVQSVRSHSYEKREKQLAEALAAGIKEKCHLIDKVFVAEKEYAAIESSAEEAKLEKESFDIPSFADSYRKGKTTNVMLMKKLHSLCRDLEEESAKRCQQEEQMMEMLKDLQALEDMMTFTKSQGAFLNLLGDQEPSPAAPLPGNGPGA
ncbi:cTAGE family member 9-like [Lontra canadensis]|uniref:cTAGE family member 9-like n=1 Tax=Lontra canadensis TaxID=76717 RepID=UPI0013F2EC70|nr:cTAGE family member 9-like [Lontra canadensis]XP_032706787.1 cTAGE family member 9-like [Lontra canadensis]